MATRTDGAHFAARLFGHGAQGLEFTLVRARGAIDPTWEEERQEPIPTDRNDEFESPMAMADVIGVPPAQAPLPLALTLSRRGEFEPVSTKGDHRLRAAPIGDYAMLLAAFRQGLVSAGESARMRKAQGDLIARLVRTTTPRWYDNWTAAASSPQRPPSIFDSQRG